MPLPGDSKYILQVVYNTGLHDEREVHEMVAQMTGLRMKQISQWFRTKRWQDRQKNRTVPTRDNPRVTKETCYKIQGEWNAENRKILEVCFNSGFCTTENFGFLETLTKLTKTQISNWARQRRWRLKKQAAAEKADSCDVAFIGRKRKLKDTFTDAFTSSKKFVHSDEELLIDEVALNILANAFEEGCLDEVDNYDTIALLAGCLVGDIKGYLQYNNFF
jgi:hypothetical protein